MVKPYSGPPAMKICEKKGQLLQATQSAPKAGEMSSFWLVSRPPKCPKSRRNELVLACFETPKLPQKHAKWARFGLFWDPQSAPKQAKWARFGLFRDTQSAPKAGEMGSFWPVSRPPKCPKSKRNELVLACFQTTKVPQKQAKWARFGLFRDPHSAPKAYEMNSF